MPFAPISSRAVRAFFVLGLALAVSLFGSIFVTAEHSSGGSRFRFSATERCFLEKINQHRLDVGRRALRWDHDLGEVARRHARKIAAERSTRHDYKYTEKITRWERLGQNTGRESSCRSMFKAFWNSSGHRDNILGGWRHAGVGVAKAGGKIYVQQIFSYKRDPGNVY